MRSKPVLWKSIVNSVKRSGSGGRSGQWSARKAQLAVKMYKKRGGKYTSRKSSSNSLVKWTKQNWRTRSGKPSVQGPNHTGERYLPEKVIRSLSRAQYNYTTRLKRKSKKQYSRNPKFRRLT